MAVKRTCPKKVRVKRNSGPYKGVRKRAWGRWVSEIWVPNTKEKIWLGSYDTAEKAARSYDAALYCFQGQNGLYNFPEDRRLQLSLGMEYSLSKKDVQAIAANYAAQEPSVPSTQVSVNISVAGPASSEMVSVNKGGPPADSTGTTPPSLEKVFDDVKEIDLMYLF